jgi:AcrR family transcriptional regulator
MVDPPALRASRQGDPARGPEDLGSADLAIDWVVNQHYAFAYMPRSQAKNEEIRASRRAQVLKAAQQVFAERGFHAANVADVAATAGVSQGTVYHYFDSKEELLMAVYEEWETANLDREIDAALAAAPTYAGKLGVLAHSAAQRIENSFDLLKAQIEFWSHIPRHEAIRERFGALFAKLADEVAQLIRAGVEAGEFRKVDPDTLARLLVASYDGLIVQWLADPAGVNWEASADTLIEVVLHGLVQVDAVHR